MLELRGPRRRLAAALAAATGLVLLRTTSAEAGHAGPDDVMHLRTGLSPANQTDGIPTALTGSIPDQPALHVSNAGGGPAIAGFGGIHGIDNGELGLGVGVLAVRQAPGPGSALQAYRDGAGFGHAVQATRAGGDGDTIFAQRLSGPGAAISGWREQDGQGDGVHGRRSGSGQGAGVSGINDSSGSGPGVSAARLGAGDGAALFADRDGSGNGPAIIAQRVGQGGGSAVVGLRNDDGMGDGVHAERNGSGNGAAITGVHQGSALGPGIYAGRIGEGPGAALFANRDGSGNGPAIVALRAGTGVGPAVSAENTSPTGVGLRVVGRSLFSSVGGGIVPPDTDSAVVTDARATPASHITVQLTSDPGKKAAVQWVERASGSFIVHLSDRTNAPTSFSYFIVDAA
ncbi:MAG TPA: hypothetical protein VGA16_04075 [Candidatus Limnocylindria bacterium]